MHEPPISSAPRPLSQRRTLLADSSSRIPWAGPVKLAAAPSSWLQQDLGRHIPNSEPGEQLFGVLVGYLIEGVS